MIVITGATGQLGRLVLSSLLKRMPASAVAAAVRNGEKAKDLAARGVQVRIADYNQPQSWDGALKGAEKVLLISSSEIGQRARQHRSVIDAATRAGVKLLAYTSVLHADISVLGLAAEHRERWKRPSAHRACRMFCRVTAGTLRTTWPAFPQPCPWARSTAAQARGA